ncbi:MAG: chorismate synthase, partial [Lachnospiraceae bacterium]
MAGSTFGTIFKISTWGESHGKGIGVVVDGCPAGLSLSEEEIQVYLDRRKPGQSKFTTARQEGDQVEILSGVFEGKTTGTPISMVIRNQDQRSRDYGNLMDTYRPGHADYTFDAKYGFRDYRGGGRSSGRETIGRVAAGAVAAKLLESLGIRVTAYTRSIGPVSVQEENFDLSEREHNRLYMPDRIAAKLAESFLEEQMSVCDSVGGVVECQVDGLPAGIG